MIPQWSGDVVRVHDDGKRTCLATTSEATAVDTAEWYRREHGYAIELTMELLCPVCGGSGRVQKRKWSVLDCKACKKTGIVGQIFNVK